jgi:hypothetical protein
VVTKGITLEKKQEVYYIGNCEKMYQHFPYKDPISINGAMLDTGKAAVSNTGGTNFQQPKHSKQKNGASSTLPTLDQHRSCMAQRCLWLQGYAESCILRSQSGPLCALITAGNTCTQAGLRKNVPEIASQMKRNVLVAGGEQMGEGISWRRGYGCCMHELHREYARSQRLDEVGIGISRR